MGGADPMIDIFGGGAATAAPVQPAPAMGGGLGDIFGSAPMGQPAPQQAAP